MLRVKRPDAHRPFRVPGGPVFPILGHPVVRYLMLSLPVITWVRFLVWLDIGLLIYWFYGRTHSPLADKQEAARRTRAADARPTSSRCSARWRSSTASACSSWAADRVRRTTETTAKWRDG